MGIYTTFDMILMHLYLPEHDRNKAGRPSQEIDLHWLHTVPEMRCMARMDRVCARRARL